MAKEGPVVPVVPVFDPKAVRGTLRKVGFKKENDKFNAAVTENVADQVKDLPVQPKALAPVAAPVKAPVKVAAVKAPAKQPMNPLNIGRALPPTPAPKAPVRRESLVVKVTNDETPPPVPPRDPIVADEEMTPPPVPPRSPEAVRIEVAPAVVAAPVAPTMAPPPPPPPPAPVAITKAPAARTALLDSIRAANKQTLKHVATPVAPAVKAGAIATRTATTDVTANAGTTPTEKPRAFTAPQAGAGVDMNELLGKLKKRPGSNLV